MTKRQKKQSTILLVILAIIIGILTLSFKLFDGDDLRNALSKSDIDVLLKEEHDKDNAALERFQKNIEKIYDDQLLEEIEVKPICVSGMMHDYIDDVGETIVKIKRLDGYVEHINSNCYKAKLLYLVGKEKTGFAKKKEIDAFRQEIWSKYFDTPSKINNKLKKQISSLIESIEENHKKSYQILNENKYKNTIEVLLRRDKRFPEFDKYLKRQENFNIAMMITSATARYSLKGLTKSLSKLIPAKIKIRSKNVYIALSAMLVAYVVQNEIQDYGNDELKVGISSQLIKMKNQFLYGDKNQVGWIYRFKKIIEQYQNIEKESYKAL